jgi:hypothetical protein
MQIAKGRKIWQCLISVGLEAGRRVSDKLIGMADIARVIDAYEQHRRDRRGQNAALP